MSSALFFLAVFLGFLIALNSVRVARGPSIYDRVLGVGVIGTNAVLLLTVFGFLYGRPGAYLDLAITYAMLNFIGVVAIAKFLDPKTGRPGGEA